VSGYTAIREDVWKLNYVFNTLRPQLGLRLVLRSPNGNPRQLDAMADLRPRTRDPWKWLDEFEAGRKNHRPRSFEYGAKAIISRLPDFAFDPDQAHTMLDQIRSHGTGPGSARKSRRLRGVSLTVLRGNVRSRLKAGRPRRPETDARLYCQVSRFKSFAGKMVVLVDSESASAAELFARAIQLEKRGVVVGDRSSGKVMEGRVHPHDVETMKGVFRFAVLITEADLIMSDGKSLENSGVIPDERVIPSGADLAAGRDPALARAAELVGIQLSPEDAGKLFPFEWPAEY
jgi:hypothetical protein